MGSLFFISETLFSGFEIKSYDSNRGVDATILTLIFWPFSTGLIHHK